VLFVYLTESALSLSFLLILIHLVIACSERHVWCYYDHVRIQYSDTGRRQCRCIVPKAVYTVKTCSWGWANL